MVFYYDNPFEIDENEHDFLGFERFYCFHWDRFNEDDWNRLAAVYERLPGWQGYGTSGTGEGCPYWFGTNEDDGPCLWGSVESPGLQIHGVLTPENWAAWNAMFQEQTADLPAIRRE